MEVIRKSAWVQVQDQKMLFLRSKGKDIFYLPGGKPEANESGEEALVREIKEEADVDLSLSTITEVMRFALPAHGRENTIVEITAYYSDYKGEITATSEIEEIGWFDSYEEQRVPSAGKVILRWLKEQNLVN